MTEPALIKKWLGNSRAAITAAEVDFRVGGAYRYEFKRKDGVAFSFSGAYREIADDRVVHTERFNGNPEEAAITTTWAERDGKTTMTIVMRAVLRAGQGRRRIETEGEARWKQESKVSPS